MIYEDKQEMHDKAFSACINIHRTSGYLNLILIPVHNVILLVSILPLFLLIMMAFFEGYQIFRNVLFGVFICTLTASAYPAYSKIVRNAWERCNDILSNESDYLEKQRRQLNSFYENN